jgi:glycosyltransferase involved in cell wall biosynthesis
MSNAARAQAAFKAGAYRQSVVLYGLAAASQPELADGYRFWQALARKRLLATGPGDGGRAVDMHGSGLYLADLWAQADELARTVPVLTDAQRPLVSVLMTAHNVEAYIEHAVTSVLRQTWQHLELVVVDDASTDLTPVVLERLRQSDERIRMARLNCNLGTYFAKNMALTLARGRFVFFQDGDDLCHPERLRLMMDRLMRPGVCCVQGAYSRVAFPDGRVLPVNGVVAKPGLITLGLRRDVFDELGYFNCTTKASDDEFFQRLQHNRAHQPGSIVTLEWPLYFNTFREGSLFRDMVGNDALRDGHIEQVPSPSRADYVQVFRAFHQSRPSAVLKQAFGFPVLRDVLPVATDMTRLSNPVDPVVVALCSIPERAEQLHATLRSLAPQADTIHLYLDRYEREPGFLAEFPDKLTVWRSQQHPGLRDNGKLLPLSTLTAPCYYFTCDDDIVYPPDYVHCLVTRLEAYRRRVVLGVHGVLLTEQSSGYFSGFRKVFNFEHPLESDQLVNVLGTGTVALHTSLCHGLDVRQFNSSGMLDVWLAAWCKAQGVPMLTIARHAHWLQEQKSDAPSLFAQYLSADEAQAELVRRHAPWGYAAIATALDQTARHSPDLAAMLSGMLPLLRNGLR